MTIKNIIITSFILTLFSISNDTHASLANTVPGAKSNQDALEKLGLAPKSEAKETISSQSIVPYPPKERAGDPEGKAGDPEEIARLKAQIAAQQKKISELQVLLKEGNLMGGEDADPAIKKHVADNKVFQEEFGTSKAGSAWNNTLAKAMINDIFEAEDALYVLNALKEWMADADGKHQEYLNALNQYTLFIYASTNDEIKKILEGEAKRQLKFDRENLMLYAEKAYNDIKTSATFKEMVADLATFPPQMQLFHFEKEAKNMRRNGRLLTAIAEASKFLSDEQYLALLYFVGSKMGLTLATGESSRSDMSFSYRLFAPVKLQYGEDGTTIRSIKFSSGFPRAPYNPKATEVETLQKIILSSFSSQLFDWEVLKRDTAAFAGDFNTVVEDLKANGDILKERPMLMLLVKDLGDLKTESKRTAIENLLSIDNLNATSKSDLKAILFNFINKGDPQIFHKNLQQLIKTFFSTIKERRNSAGGGGARILFPQIERHILDLAGGVLPEIEGLSPVVPVVVASDYDTVIIGKRAGFAGSFGVINTPDYINTNKKASPVLVLLTVTIDKFKDFDDGNRQALTNSQSVIGLGTKQELEALYYHITSDKGVYDANEELRGFIKELAAEISQRIDNTRGTGDMLTSIRARKIKPGS